jgi:hypothetical protein
MECQELFEAATRTVEIRAIVYFAIGIATNLRMIWVSGEMLERASHKEKGGRAAVAFLLIAFAVAIYLVIASIPNMLYPELEAARMLPEWCR